MVLSQKNLIIFNAISQFVEQLNEVFGAKQKSLALYARLIKNTTLSSEVAILKHIEVFSNFINNNKIFIETRVNSFAGNIAYSERVKIDLTYILNNADTDSKTVIWQHLITILGIITPDSKAKNALKDLQESKKKNVEKDLINNMINKISPHITGGDENPMSVIISLMSSGVFNELATGMQQGMNDGNIDINTLLGSVSSMLTQDSPGATVEEVVDDNKKI